MISVTIFEKEPNANPIPTCKLTSLPQLPGLQWQTKKVFLGRHEEESLRGTKLKNKPVLFWMKPDNAIIRRCNVHV